MRRTWLAAGLFLLVAFATVCATMRAQRDPFAPHPLVAGQPYAVDVDQDQADFDLEFPSDARYSLVISSLARNTGSFTVAASSRPVGAPRLVPRAWVPPAAPLSKQACSIPTTPESGTRAASCGRHPLDGPSRSPASRTFALHVTEGSLDDPTQYARVPAHEVAVGSNVRVYLDDQQSAKDLAPGLVQNIVDLFDNELISRFGSVFGTYRDVDGDGRFSVLLSPWLARLQGGRTSIGGFVRGSDFQPHVAPPFSNRCDMMYVNSQTIPGPHLRTLLIHEYTHALSFSIRSGDEPRHAAFPEEEDWLNEALAHCAESLFDGGWTNLDYRISRYLNETAAYPLVVEDYYRAGLWRCHGCRGATYLFLRYCIERFGTQTLAQLINTPARGTRNLELATGCSFARLYRDWTLSLLTNSRALPMGAEPDSPSNAAKTGGRLACLDLYGSLGPWGLAGPRQRHWDVDSGSLTLDLKGTSAAFIELSASRVPGARRIHLAGSPGTQLQVSLVRLRDEMPRIEIEAAWSHSTSARATLDHLPNTGATTDDTVRVVANVQCGADFVIEQISAEQNLGNSHASMLFAPESLKLVEVPTSMAGGTDSGGTKGRSFSPLQPHRFELPADRLSALGCPVIVKVVGVDRNGRRATGWATVPERDPQQVTALSGTRR
jgi:hypothetical protein